MPRCSRCLIPVWLLAVLLAAVPVLAQPADQAEPPVPAAAPGEVQTPAAAPAQAAPQPPAGATFTYALNADGTAAVDDAGNPVLVDSDRFTLDNLWILLAGCMVFIMHLGFATVEAGLNRAKNTVNILFKNVMIAAIGLVVYALVGFALMYPGEGFNGVLGFGDFSFLGLGVHSLNDPSLMAPGDAGYGLEMTTFSDFFFQAMFAATCCTIVSGAVAGRVRLAPFLAFSAVFAGLAYTITGSWKWGGGWLYWIGEDGQSIIRGTQLPGFYDFAGSTVVHSVGGWAALAGAYLVGPRLGKYSSDGAVNPIPGHSMPLATMGVMLLWFGWFGFNGGSVLSADAGLVSLVMVTTALAGACGGIATAVTSWVVGGKPDLSMSLNGILAGLVGITAGADQMAVWEAMVIGAVAGVLVYFAVLFFDRVRIDDPVGAVSVHLVCGIWGTLAVGLFGALAGWQQFQAQVVGAVSIGLFTVVFAAVAFGLLRVLNLLRVSEAEEIEGLDLGEHDMSAYPDFQQTFIKSYHAREI